MAQMIREEYQTAGEAGGQTEIRQIQKLFHCQIFEGRM